MNSSGLDITFHRFKAILTDPVKFQNFVRTNKKELLYWGLLGVSIIVIYFLFSDGDFSFFLTLSGMIQMFGFFLIALKVQNTQTVSGISLNSLIAYSVSFFSRLCSILRHEGYLPYDSSGDFIYRIGEFLAFFISLYMIFMTAVKYKTTYNWDLDRVNCLALIIPSFILAILIHPGLNNSYFSDISWTFSLYLESIAMFPQLYMFFKKGGEVEAFTSHFVASQGISRCFALVFWIFSYNELNEYPGTIWGLFKGYVGYIVMLFQILQIVLFSDFLYEYIKSMRRGLPMTVQSYLV
jgi:hypothetical protein